MSENLGMKTTALISVILLCIAAASACGASGIASDGTPVQTENCTPPAVESSAVPAADADETADVTGIYRFEDNVYTNMLSSFMPVKDSMPFYVITDKMLEIVWDENGSAESFEGTADPMEVSKGEFDALFMEDPSGAPDISPYQQCMQYAVYKDEAGQSEYRVYLMDDEVWLANIRTRMWSIYRLAKMTGTEISQHSSVGIIGGADGPTSVYITKTDDPAE